MSQHAEPRTANSSPTMSVEVDGTRFAYREFGSSTGVPVVFLHHFTAVLDDWDPRVIDGIASQRRVITFDNRGIGGTQGRTPTTVSAMADDAIAFTRALGLEQVDLMGFSLGGFISQAIVTKKPALVRRIILAGTGPAGGDGVGNFSRRLIGDTLHGLLTLNDPKPYLFFTRTANGKAAATAYMDRLKERTRDRVKRTSPRGVAAQLFAIHRWGAQDPMDLSSIEQPVLVANGEDDRMLPTRASFDLAHRLPNSSLRIYPDSGHGGVFQCHEKFVPQVLEFLW
ncbi:MULTISPECIES: alpha/beta hydrolase [unclassified Mycobacterium]|uniref:alpha/beta fold hydrolase n=1 Tax=unclassified Mycobacterium TaxID=2642494 RepID=UPI0029C94791|nr:MULTISPECIES: alpha/beta hydrolase [unclassified Mycobacterium]